MTFGEPAFKNRIYGFSAMVCGPLLVFGLVVVMNNWKDNDNGNKNLKMTEVQAVQPKKPKPKKKLEKPKPKPKPKKMRAPTPFKGLNTALSGIDLGLPGFMGEDLNLVDSGLLGSTQASVMTEDLVDVAPRPKYRSAFKYPKQAKKKGITGYVVVSLLIDDKGNVEQVQVLESSPSGVFDSVVEQGIQDWRFEPAQYQGRPVKVWAKQKIRFDFA